MGATTLYGLRYPELTDRPAGDEQLLALAEDTELALRNLVPDSGTLTDTPITAAAGWSVMIKEHRLIGKEMTLHLMMRRDGTAITASAAGNITGEPLVATISNAALRPVMNVYGAFRASLTSGGFSLSTAGEINLNDAHSGSSIAAPDSDGGYHTVQIYAEYPIP